MNRFFNAYPPNTVQSYNTLPVINPYMQRPVAPIAPIPAAAPNYTPIIQNFGVPQQNLVQNTLPNQTNIIWVDNENEIQSYPSGRGWQQWFGNKNDQILYVRETDANGNVQPIAKLRYEIIEDIKVEKAEPVVEQKQEPAVVKYDGPTREEFNQLSDSVNLLVDKLGDLLK